MTHYHLFHQAEHRIAARRAARQEAREIRMREIERQQREVWKTCLDYSEFESKLYEATTLPAV